MFFMQDIVSGSLQVVDMHVRDLACTINVTKSKAKTSVRTASRMLHPTLSILDLAKSIDVHHLSLK